MFILCLGAISASIHNNKNLQKSCPCDFCDFSNCVFSYSPCTPFIHKNFVFVQHIIVLWRSGASFRPSFAFFNKKRPSYDGLFLLNLVGVVSSTVFYIHYKSLMHTKFQGIHLKNRPFPPQKHPFP